MKNSFFNLLLLLTPIFITTIAANAQGIEFENTDWEAVKAKAKEEHKSIFVDTYASWCEPCKWMDQNTFTKAEVGSFFKENFVSYKINVEKGDGLALAEKYQVLSYPTLLFFDENGELVHRLIGAFKPNELLEKSKDALNPEKQIYTLQKKFMGGERDTDFLVQYAYAMKSVNEDCDKVVDVYLETQGEEQLLEEATFQFLEHFVNDYEHPSYQYVAGNKAKFVLKFGKDRVDSYLDAAFKIRCYEIIENAAGKAAIKEFHQEVKRLLPDRSDYFKTRMDFYYNRGDGRKDYRMAKKYEKHCKDSKSLNSLARYLLDMHGGSKSHMESALGWVDKAILMEENGSTLETKVMILLSLDRNEEALLVAEKRLAWCRQAEKDVEKAAALVDEIKNK